MATPMRVASIKFASLFAIPQQKVELCRWLFSKLGTRLFHACSTLTETIKILALNLSSWIKVGIEDVRPACIWCLEQDCLQLIGLPWSCRIVCAFRHHRQTSCVDHCYGRLACSLFLQTSRFPSTKQFTHHSLSLIGFYFLYLMKFRIYLVLYWEYEIDWPNLV